MFKKSIVVWVVITSLLLIVGTGWTQQSSLLKKASKDKVPVVITAQQAEFDNKVRKAVYKGSVKVVRADATMFSDQLEAFFDQTGKELDHIVATGNVKVIQENRIITAEEGIYYNAEQKIVLTGNPVSKEGESVVEGSRMTYFFNQERVIVEDAKSVLRPDKVKKQDEDVEVKN